MIVSLSMSGGLELDDLLGPLQPTPFYDPVILCYDLTEQHETVLS